MRTRPAGLNLITMSEPLSATQMFCCGSMRTVCPNDQAYRFLPISRTNLPVASNSRSCAAAAAYAGPVVLPRDSTKMCPLAFTATPVASPRYVSLGICSGSDPSKGITGMSCANAGEASASDRATSSLFMVFSSGGWMRWNSAKYTPSIYATMNPEIARTLRTLLAAACLAVAAHATAQDPEPTWRVALGAGLDYVPKFPGSDSHKILPLPFIAASYGRFFFGAFPGAASIAGVGVNLYQDRHWRFGAAISAGLAERKESDDARLQGLGDVRRTASAGVALAYTQDWYVLGGSVLSDILNRSQGTLVSLNALARHRASDRLTFF